MLGAVGCAASQATSTRFLTRPHNFHLEIYVFTSNEPLTLITLTLFSSVKHKLGDWTPTNFKTVED